MNLMKSLLFLLAATLWFGCSNSNSTQTPTLISSEEINFEVDTLATGLEHPWGLAFLPDGRILIAERPGRLSIWEDGHLADSPVSGLPDIWARGQGGLLDVELHPDYENNQMIYLAFAKQGDDGGSTAIARGRLTGDELQDTEVIFHASPHTGAGQHFGSRIVFDDHGYLYTTVGDRGVMQTSQDLTSHNGAIIRLYDDGSVPGDNPFAGEEEGLPEIWSYGHRNIQGMKINPETRELWAVEHGPKGGDEINRIHKGGNYGWPEVTHGVNYDGSIITPDTTKPGMIDPILHWTPSIAPCGMDFVDSDLYPGWEENMMVGALANQHIHRVVFSDTTVVHTEKLLEGMARFRTVEQGPDGYLYVLTESPGLFFRILPQ